ncbi:MAG: hypothetical protein GY835_25645 [bacterium]|nr:hypothetical protein [bacterium]
MMTHKDALLLLNDHIDGVLSPDHEDELHDHLATCPSCRAELDQLRALVTAAADLPEDIQPERDLWTGIEQMLEGHPRRMPASPRRSKAWFVVGGIGLAAAIILVTLGMSGILFREQVEIIPDNYANTASHYIEMMEAECRQGEVALHAAIDNSNESVTLVRMRDDIQIIDQALEESISAWRANPHNRRLARLVMTSYRFKVDLLNKAARVASNT